MRQWKLPTSLQSVAFKSGRILGNMGWTIMQFGMNIMQFPQCRFPIFVSLPCSAEGPPVLVDAETEQIGEVIAGLTGLAWKKEWLREEMIVVAFLGRCSNIQAIYAKDSFHCLTQREIIRSKVISASSSDLYLCHDHECRSQQGGQPVFQPYSPAWRVRMGGEGEAAFQISRCLSLSMLWVCDIICRIASLRLEMWHNNLVS